MRIGNLAMLSLAMIIEVLVGYPEMLYRAVGHPVGWIGAGIDWCDRRWNQPDGPEHPNRLRGAGALLLVLGVVATVAMAVQVLLIAAFGALAGTVCLAVLAATLLASRSLYEHVRDVGIAVQSSGLAAGRVAVARIVGRNPASLDEAAVLRAAIESLAENFSDAVVAPVFWGCLLGLPGIVLYKAANTADSMLGHRTPRHRSFGWAAARFDDAVNLPASRIAGTCIVLAAFSLSDANGVAALRAVCRDSARHRSPNAGWPEAAMAGALGLRLAGPRVYGEMRIEDAWMGDGRSAAEPADLVRALALYRRACALLIAVVLALAGLVWI